MPLTHLLDPKQDPTLRLTALGAVDHLLSDEAFCSAPPLTEWAEHILAAMLLPNLVWRAGRVAEQVRPYLPYISPISRRAGAASPRSS